MESGHSIHYEGNTVELPRPGRKRLKKNSVLSLGDVVSTERMIGRQPKVCAAYRCVWCDFGCAQPMVICWRCHNCQYCGQYQGAGYDHECIRCGNHLDLA